MKKIIPIIAGVIAVVVALDFFVFHFLIFPKPKPEGEIIARVGDSVFTLEDYTRLIPPSIAPQVNPQVVVNQWVHRELFYQEAKKRGIERREDIKRRINEIKKDVIAQELMQEEAQKIIVTREEAYEYFNRRKEDFLYEVKISQIVLPNRAEADEVYRELGKGADFKKLAKEKSIDRLGGEESRFFPRGTGLIPLMVEELVFSLNKGEICEPFQTPDGMWHIIKLVDKRQVKKEAKFEDWEEYIRVLLRNNKLQQRMGMLGDSLSRVYKVEIYWETLIK